MFAALLASLPAQNLDIWQHLANGRELLRGTGTFSSTWLFDLTIFSLFWIAGGIGLAAAKAILCAAVAVLMFLASWVESDWRLSLAVLSLSVLAIGSRVVLDPATVSLVFLAIAMNLLIRESSSQPGGWRFWPGWPLVLLFLLWANVDGRFVIGLGFVALVWLGRALDARRAGRGGPELGRGLGAVAVLILVSCCSPQHVKALDVPPELRSAVASLRTDSVADSGAVNSPFTRDYLLLFRERPAWLAYYPLLGLSLIAVLLNWRGRRWARVLPLVGLAIASGLQGRLIPYFAVVAGPVTVWNVREFFARRGAAAPVRGRLQIALTGISLILAAAFLIAAWPGWLQGAPYQPRRWVVETPTAHQRGAEYLTRARAAKLWPEDAKTLHTSAETRGVFAWFGPDDHGILDIAVLQELTDAEDQNLARDRLRSLRVGRIVVDAGDKAPTSTRLFLRLLSDPYEWPVLHLTGGVVVFGWRDPAASGRDDPYVGRALDFDRLAYKPDESEKAPASQPARSQRWQDAFRVPAPPQRPLGREEAVVLLRKAELTGASSQLGQLVTWGSLQATGLAGAGGGWTSWSGVLDAGVRSAMLTLPQDGPLPPLVDTAMAYRQQFGFEQGDVPVGLVYAAIRAARRATAENPQDANSHLVLGRSYVALLNLTQERGWAARLPQLRKLRQMQASAAFNRAVVLNPNLAAAHLELGQLYRSLNCLDLTVHHLRTYRELPACFGGLGAIPQRDRRTESFDSELERLNKSLEFHLREFARESANTSVTDRAQSAARRGLVGEARDLLLKSDVSAFGAQGADLELSLLLHSGRPDDVLSAMTPELTGLLGAVNYHWLRSQAHVAMGDYDAADEELRQLAGPGSGLPTVEFVGYEVAGLLGKTLLDTQPGNYSLAGVLLAPLGRDALQSRITEITANLQRPADVIVIRGLVALESGNTARAREALRTSLSFSPRRVGGGQLEFNGRRVAWDALRLLGE